MMFTVNDRNERAHRRCICQSVAVIADWLFILLFPFQRADKEQRDLASRWTELGTDEPGICNMSKRFTVK